MTKADQIASIIDEILHPKAAITIFDYDYLYDIFCGDEPNASDLIVALSYHISVSAKTTEEYRNAANYVAKLAVTILNFNFMQDTVTAEIEKEIYGE